jgi:hypothetical protein
MPPEEPPPNEESGSCVSLNIGTPGLAQPRTDEDKLTTPADGESSSDNCTSKVSDEKLAALPNLEADLENGEGAELKRNPSTIIPRKKRRGLFAQLVVGIPEIEDPVQYSRKIKNVIVFIIAIAAVAAPMGYFL